MTGAEDMAARSKQLAQQILDALDAPDDPAHLAALEAKDRRDKDALERFYIATGQKKWLPASVAPAPLVAAWDHAQDPPGLAIYAVGDSGGTRVGDKPVAKAGRDATTADLKKRGVRVGGVYGGVPVVWVADEYGVSIWSQDAVQVEGTRAELTLADGTLRAADIAEIVSFVGDDYVWRGVKAVLRDGREVLLVDEHDEIARLDPTFGRNELIMSDAWWARYLGRDVAASLRVPYRDGIFGTQSDPAIVLALQDLADRIQALLPSGAFEPIAVPLVAARGRKATVRFMALAWKPEGDPIVDVTVATPSGISTSTQWLIQAPNEQIVAMLRRSDTADDVDTMIDALAESLQRHNLA